MTVTPLRRSGPAPGQVEAFLDPAHVQMAARLVDLVVDLGRRTAPESDDEARSEARALLNRLGEEGWFAPIAAMDLRACCLIREALAAASPLADAVFALQALGTTPLLRAAPGPLRDRWVPQATGGTAMAAFAMTEREAGTDVGAMRTTAVSEAGDWVLNGTKTLISNAGIADFYVVFASTEPAAGSRGITAFLVPADTDGLTFLGPQVLSAPHPLGEIELERCRVPEDHVIGPVGGGFKIGMATLDRIRPTVGAAACGMASRAFEEAVAHAATRRQFGQALAEFQIIQEKLGRMHIELIASRLLVYRAARAGDTGTERISLEASAAKSFATEAAQRIVDEAVQILGGRGVLADHPVDRLYRSIRALRIYEGTTEIQRIITARQLLAERAQHAE